MRTKYFFLLLLFLTTVCLCFQGCDQLTSSDSNNGDVTESDEADQVDSLTTDEPENIPELEDKPHSELSVQEYSDFITKHAEHLETVDKKFVAIKNEHVKKKDQFTLECENGEAHLERLYNDNDEVHLLSISNYKDDNSSVKHHYFEGGKLIYQFYHHVVQNGETFMVDDHRTFFKDGKMLKCLEKRYSYKNGESEPFAQYELVTCQSDLKLTADIDKLVTMSEEDAKAFLCK
ncbi:MAG: hypothetical protein AAF502_18840 [Bacteroidota bacterium]